uniref:Uncharacterized protein n=1 Tax=Panagrolaimus sp. JU765 TaxID=591449 RepID=A0AC34R6A1_9BILA
MFLWPKLWDIPELEEPTQEEISDCEIAENSSQSSCSRIEVQVKMPKIPIEIFETASDEETLLEESNLVDVPLPQPEPTPGASSQIQEPLTAAQISEEWPVHVSIHGDSDLNEGTPKCFNFRQIWRRFRERFF